MTVGGGGGGGGVAVIAARAAMFKTGAPVMDGRPDVGMTV